VKLGIGRQHTGAENKCTIEEKVHQMGRLEGKETAAAADPSRHDANSTRLSLTWQTPAMHNKFLVSIGRHSYVSLT
jgi:hypothetical protein